jgi:large subunit ribosomal protein L31
MKKDIHPEFRKVVFEDVSVGKRFIVGSTVISKEKVVLEDGNEYPLVKLGVSSYSHPFYTGEMRQLDVAGRIDKFRKKYQR